MFLITPALNGLYCADVPLSNYSLTHSPQGVCHVAHKVKLGILSVLRG